MDDEAGKVLLEIRKILKKKAEENRALRNLIKAIHPDQETTDNKLKIEN